MGELTSLERVFVSCALMLFSFIRMHQLAACRFKFYPNDVANVLACAKWESLFFRERRRCSANWIIFFLVLKGWLVLPRMLNRNYSRSWAFMSSNVINVFLILVALWISSFPKSEEGIVFQSRVWKWHVIYIWIMCVCLPMFFFA